MPFALVFVGLIMIVTGANNTYAAFGSQLKKDFSGDKSFLLWIAAIGSVGALGYIPQLRKFSHYFMALILISIFLSNRGFFQKFVDALKNNQSNTQISVRPGGTTSGAASDGTAGTSLPMPSFADAVSVAKFAAIAL